MRQDGEEGMGGKSKKVKLFPLSLSFLGDGWEAEGRWDKGHHKTHHTQTRLTDTHTHTRIYTYPRRRVGADMGVPYNLEAWLDSHIHTDTHTWCSPVVEK